MSPQAIADIAIEDLPNIKPVSISRLKRIGIESVLELGMCTYVVLVFRNDFCHQLGQNLASEETSDLQTVQFNISFSTFYSTL